jgi:hypothetical protein
MSTTCRQVRLPCLLALASCLVAGCALDVPEDDDSEDEPQSVTVPPTGLFGIDTNQVSGYPELGDGSNLKIHYAKRQNIGWAGRYIVSDGRGHEAITYAEVHRWLDAGISVALLWEVNDQHRACNASGPNEEFDWGARDGFAAKKYMNETLHAPPGVAVYFTVDFLVTWNQWDHEENVDDCNGASSRKMILKYFEGIRSTFDTNPIGVYGSYGTVRGLLNEVDLTKIQYAWQQDFPRRGHRNKQDNGRIDPRAILLQNDIHPRRSEWLEHPHKKGGLDFDISLKGVVSMWTPGEK